MNAPLVTVLIPAYNAADTIARALDSALNQSYEPKEIVVVNDASTDETSNIVARYASKNVILVNLDSNVGVCGAMNAGLDKAAGEYIAFLDADDEWRAGKLEKQLAVLQQDPELTFVTCDGDFLEADGAVADTVYSEPSVDGPNAWKTLLAYSFVAKPCVVAKKAAILSCGGFNKNLRLAEDQDMWIKLAAKGPIKCLQESLVSIHLNPGSLTQTNVSNEATYLLPMIYEHIENLAGKLTNSEKRRILVHRWYEVGRSLCEDGAWFEGAKFLGRTILAGYRVPVSVHFVLTTSPPARWLKRLIGRE